MHNNMAAKVLLFFHSAKFYIKYKCSKSQQGHLLHILKPFLLILRVKGAVFPLLFTRIAIVICIWDFFPDVHAPPQFASAQI